jgi:hypothetical protein
VRIPAQLHGNCPVNITKNCLIERDATGNDTREWCAVDGPFSRTIRPFANKQPRNRVSPRQTVTSFTTCKTDERIYFYLCIFFPVGSMFVSAICNRGSSPACYTRATSANPGFTLNLRTRSKHYILDKCAQDRKIWLKQNKTNSNRNVISLTHISSKQLPSMYPFLT